MKLGYVILYVGDVDKTMTFYEAAFSLNRGFISEDKEYGEMVTGDTKLGFVSHALVETNNFKYDRMSTHRDPGSSEIAFTTTDVEKAYIRAIENGALALTQPTKKPWGQTVGLVRDMNGFIVEISSPMGT